MFFSRGNSRNPSSSVKGNPATLVPWVSGVVGLDLRIRAVPQQAFDHRGDLGEGALLELGVDADRPFFHVPVDHHPGPGVAGVEPGHQVRLPRAEPLGGGVASPHQVASRALAFTTRTIARRRFSRASCSWSREACLPSPASVWNPFRRWPVSSSGSGPPSSSTSSPWCSTRRRSPGGPHLGRGRRAHRGDLVGLSPPGIDNLGCGENRACRGWVARHAVRRRRDHEGQDATRGRGHVRSGGGGCLTKPCGLSGSTAAAPRPHRGPSCGPPAGVSARALGAPAPGPGGPGRGPSRRPGAGTGPAAGFRVSPPSASLGASGQLRRGSSASPSENSHHASGSQSPLTNASTLAPRPVTAALVPGG